MELISLICLVHSWSLSSFVVRGRMPITSTSAWGHSSLICVTHCMMDFAMTKGLVLPRLFVPAEIIIFFAFAGRHRFLARHSMFSTRSPPMLLFNQPWKYWLAMVWCSGLFRRSKYDAPIKMLRLVFVGFCWLNTFSPHVWEEMERLTWSKLRGLGRIGWQCMSGKKKELCHLLWRGTPLWCKLGVGSPDPVERFSSGFSSGFGTSWLIEARLVPRLKLMCSCYLKRESAMV